MSVNLLSRTVQLQRKELERRDKIIKEQEKEIERLKCCMEELMQAEKEGRITIQPPAKSARNATETSL